MRYSVGIKYHEDSDSIAVGEVDRCYFEFLRLVFWLTELDYLMHGNTDNIYLIWNIYASNRI
jgi:hypothetical protein